MRFNLMYYSFWLQKLKVLKHAHHLKVYHFILHLWYRIYTKICGLQYTTHLGCCTPWLVRERSNEIEMLHTTQDIWDNTDVLLSHSTISWHLCKLELFKFLNCTILKSELGWLPDSRCIRYLLEFFAWIKKI